MSQIQIRKSILALAACCMSTAVSAQEIPHPWTDASIGGFRLPLAGLGHAPKMVSGDEYYALPEVNVKTYPVYAPGKEPPNYIEWLKAREPEPLVDVSKLKTPADWIAAGKEVFYGRELPRFSGSEDNLALIRDPKIVAAYRLQTTKDGGLAGVALCSSPKRQSRTGHRYLRHVPYTRSGRWICN